MTESPAPLRTDSFLKGRHLLFAVAAILLGAALVLGAAEGVLRILDYPFRTSWIPSENAMAQFDPELGWSYIPNRSVTQRFGSDGHPITMYFNDIGARVGEPRRHFDSTSPTALFVGDSYTFGHGVTYEESFVGQFERNSGLPFQVVNLGVQGYGTDQAFLALKRHVEEFNTKVVVYTFLLEHVKRNDNADRRLIYSDAKFLGTKPRFALKRDGTLEVVEKPRRYEEMTQLRLWQLVQLAWAKYGPPPSMELTRALVRDMKDYVEARGATFVLILWTYRHSLPPGQQAGQFFPGIHLNVIDTGAGAPVDWDSWHIPGERHPDARAHARIARLLMEKFKELGLVPPASATGIHPPQTHSQIKRSIGGRCGSLRGRRISTA
jgi:hypothetical protein